MPLHLETPLLESLPVALAAKRPVLLKMEAMQQTGSFKIRGVGAVCEHHAAQGKQHFISSSGGNAGIAVAYAGRHLGIPVTVFVPETTSAHARHLIRQEGAELVVHGASWQEANERAVSAMTSEAAFIHPFDDPIMWEGHATMIDEAVRGGAAFDAVVLSVGGGGLLCGVTAGLIRNGLPDVPVIAVETEGAASLSSALKAGKPVEIPAITSIATSLGARKVCEQAFRIAQTRSVESIVVSDQAAVSACLQFMEDHRVIVEPACGAALAIAYTHADRLEHYARILIIVCGGATTSVENLMNFDA